MIKLPQVAYHEVTELPFSHKMLDSLVYDTAKVRGLVSIETKELSKKEIKSITLKELRDIYNDGIIVLEKDGEKVSIDKLIEADLYFLMFLVNILTQPDYAVNYRANCIANECEAKIPFRLTIDNIQFKEIPVPAFPIPAKLSIGEMFHIHPLTLSDLIQIEDWATKDKTLEASELRLGTALRLGKYEDDIEATEPLEIVKERVEALGQLHSSDRQLIEEKMDLLKFELKLIKVVCPKCKAENEFSLSIQLKDLIPLI